MIFPIQTPVFGGFSEHLHQLATSTDITDTKAAVPLPANKKSRSDQERSLPATPKSDLKHHKGLKRYARNDFSN